MNTQVENTKVSTGEIQVDKCNIQFHTIDSTYEGIGWTNMVTKT